MSKQWEQALGEPEMFLKSIRDLAAQLMKLATVEVYDLQTIRSFVASRKFLITKTQDEFRCVVAAFAVLLVDEFGQKVCIGGVWKKNLRVSSRGFSCDLLELFNRCVFEGLDLDGKLEIK